MELKQAIQSRRSIRGFLPNPISKEILSEVLTLAGRAISSQNMQPWEYILITGNQLELLRKYNIQDMNEEVAFNMSTPDTTGIYRERKVAIAKQLFKAMGIRREDREKRNWWTSRGFVFFNAPVLILLMTKLQIDPMVSQFDMGCVAQNLCYAALEYGLGTCVERQAIMYQNGIQKMLHIPEEDRLVMGIAVGYPDPQFPANQIISARENIDQITTWVGFYTDY